MDQYRSRLKLSENFGRHWSILISGEIHMDQSLVHIFSWGNSYGPMVLKVFLKFPPTLVLVREWLFPVLGAFWGKFWPEKITSRDGCFLLIQKHLVQKLLAALALNVAATIERQGAKN